MARRVVNSPLTRQPWVNRASVRRVHTSLERGPHGLPAKQGLYDPANEKDSCGVGFVVDIKGRPSRQTITDANEVLVNMTHRGASGCEPNAGDGAGIMTAIPHDFFTKCGMELGFQLPPKGEYAAGMLFMNKDVVVRERTRAMFTQIANEAGLKIIGWRVVPTDNSSLGETAIVREPSIEQVFLVPDSGVTKAQELRKKAFMVSKQAGNLIAHDDSFYICSLSLDTIVYKGQLTCGQLFPYFSDLRDPLFLSHFATVHSRFSTNTFPSWERAQPSRVLAHNGEINTLRGNVNAMNAREGQLASTTFGPDLQKLFPIIDSKGSDSQMLDNTAEFLVQDGRSLPEVMMMMVPEAWENATSMPKRRKEFYQYASNITEPWDGPALLAFADGRYVGAILDRNGLRPSRYYVTADHRVIMASEVGTVYVDPKTVISKGKLQPGKMLVVDTFEGHIIEDAQVKREVARKHPYGEWVKEATSIASLVKAREPALRADATALELTNIKPLSKESMAMFAYTREHFDLLMLPMLSTGKEALGSMGNDAPLACLSKMPRLPYEYFKQLFAQVTNPPIDPFREAVVMSLRCPIGPAVNLLASERAQCDRLVLDTPILTLSQFDAIKNVNSAREGWSSQVIDITYPANQGEACLKEALARVCEDVSAAIKGGNQFAVLSDRGLGPDRVPLSSLFAVGAVHQHLVREKTRMDIGLIIESGEAREVHHHCMLLGYGADAICPYNAFGTMKHLDGAAALSGLSEEQMVVNYVTAADTGIKKVMAKMGISTLASYKGAQIFEAVGLCPSVIDECFTGTLSKIKGKNFDHFSEQALRMHQWAYAELAGNTTQAPMYNPGDYYWRQGGETHGNNPAVIANLQDAIRTKNRDTYDKFSLGHKMAIQDCTIRGQFNFIYQPGTKIAKEEIESAAEIVKRFATGAMSYGSISKEAHETLAKAMNMMGGKSNTGEGGEAADRYSDPTRRSAIKQVASGRFGVTIDYLSSADEIQIKMAQGAKPGEGGELPGYKVVGDIAETRRSTPGVGLISPPPHHDIYSIEDLSQLIMDLKCSNPSARISVKLVSKGGVGVIATGVAKGLADHILISGHDGGTGASSWTGVKHAGLPWELGLSETHQTLVLNGLRGRVALQADGQVRTGRDVVIACLLGAEEFGFATAPLIAMGCTMMRKCHLNTCPVGIATQDPELRKKFAGQPEHVVNYFFMVAEEVRNIMSRLGFRTVNEMVGRTDMLTSTKTNRQGRPVDSSLDLSDLLVPAYTMRGGDVYCRTKQDHRIDDQLDMKILEQCLPALEHKKPVKISTPIKNTDRVFGTIISHEVAKRYGPDGLPDGTIHMKVNGSAGQSLGAFLAKGVSIELEGDANDYVGKGLSGGRIVAYPGAHHPDFVPENNSIVGNVCLYGATGGEAYFRGVASNRFAVRNSGATAVVEGVGDHACEYMTGGRVVVLGATGRNFGAGMSGGIAYVLRTAGDVSFNDLVNHELVSLDKVDDGAEAQWLKHTLEEHQRHTGSSVAQRLLDKWEESSVQEMFIKIMPNDYKKALESNNAEAEKSRLESRLEAIRQESQRIRAALMVMKNGGVPIVAPAPAAPEPEIVLPRPTFVKGVSDKIKGFMSYARKDVPTRSPENRVTDWDEIMKTPSDDDMKVQTARCMDCGVPFCNSAEMSGCPLGNIIPSFNDMVHKGRWQEALQELLLTNNFPEFTGRVCPAPCEGACVLGINEDPVSIKGIEMAIIDRGFKEGWIVPNPPSKRTGKKIAVVGSGPAGLAAADQLNKAGHTVTVYERADRFGGLLMYGIPNMKLDKAIVQRRIDLMEAEGINFVANAEVGVNVDVDTLRDENDAILLTVGATRPRDLILPGRESEGIHFAMDYLEPATKLFLGGAASGDTFAPIDARGKRVVVIGGGDTGVDCIATALRQGAKSITTFEIMDKPPVSRAEDNPWPQWPKILRHDYGHKEVMVQTGKDPRQFAVMSKEFVQGADGTVEGINISDVHWTEQKDGTHAMEELPGTFRNVPGDLVFLAMGFDGPEGSLASKLNIATDRRTNFRSAQTGLYKTMQDKVYVAGDCRRGQSLIVWAISEGRQAALEIDVDLTGRSVLPLQGGKTNPIDLEARQKRKGTLRRQLGMASAEQTENHNWL